VTRAAELVGISVPTYVKRAKAGLLPAVVPGGVSKSELLEVLRRRAAAAIAEAEAAATSSSE
jgi:hypothetical protein